MLLRSALVQSIHVDVDAPSSHGLVPEMCVCVCETERRCWDTAAEPRHVALRCRELYAGLLFGLRNRSSLENGNADS